jgi:hypothetical protein
MSFTLYDTEPQRPVDDYEGDAAPAKRLAEQDLFITALYDQLKEQEIKVTSVNAGKYEYYFLLVRHAYIENGWCSY